MTKRGGLAMRRLANVDSTTFVMVSTIAFMEGEEGTEAMAKLTLVSGSDDLPAISSAYGLSGCRAKSAGNVLENGCRQ
jgi:hypothetical protein